jgi:glycosyltransferase involved in cell wall biosynthesis
MEVKYKVIFFIDTLEVGGAEKSLLEIVKSFDRLIPVVCAIYQGKALKDSFHEAGIRVISLNLKGKYNYVRALKGALSVIREESPDLIHTTLARAHFIGRFAGRITGVPVVSNFVSESYSNRRVEQLSFSRKWKLGITKTIDRFTSRWAYHFIANSTTVKESSSRDLGIPCDRISVIFRGRDPNVYENHRDNFAQTFRQSHGLQPQSAMILNVGRLVQSKSQEKIIHAISQVRKVHPATLFIAGEGPDRDTLLRTIQNQKLSDCVTLLGNRSDIPQLLSAADVFVFPSSYEGFPGSLLEAMFAGRPIVASDIPVHRELIDHLHSGILVDPTPEDLAGAICWMLNHPIEAAEMGSHAREKALQKFELTNVSQQQERLLINLIEQWNQHHPGKTI